MRKNITINCLFNLCLVAVVVLTFFAAGIYNKNKSVMAFKSYNGVIYAGNEQTNKVALMINVYWGTEYLEEMLNTLEKHQAKVTFFVGGTWVQENPELLVKIKNLGHEIGNHGTNHKEHGKLSYSINYNEIKNCHDKVFRVLNLNMNLFAPPGGSYNSETVKCATSLGYKTILWTKDTIDWRDQNEDLIFHRATNNIQSGDLVLMHPTAATKNVLERVIVAINGKKLALDTVSNTIKE
jgi:peptidoglycan/xylan/chitin deacetylase (PgdA/CDA1 family)